MGQMGAWKIPQKCRLVGLPNSSRLQLVLEESDVYQGIIQEGVTQRSTWLWQGGKKYTVIRGYTWLH